MKKNILSISLLLLVLPLFGVNKLQKGAGKMPMTNTVWSIEKANAWYTQQPWLSGCNYQPCTAINQIEMWQAQTFDPETIDKELGWAEELGFNTMRVFLSSVVWKHDSEGFKQRIDRFLSICNKHNIRPMLVFFDDCWNAESAIGKQPEPKPGVHNSGWVRDPSTSLRADTATLFPILENYVKDILIAFKNDKRVLMWDLYNEPGNGNVGIQSLPLVKNAFKWAREVNPSQPLTVGVWYINSFEMKALNVFQVNNSDVLTYHNYGNETEHETWVNLLKIHERPMICTEYMARKNGSFFQKVMPMLKRQNVGAINWGFVSGKTNTIFAWSEPLPDQKEPKIWFHDIFRQDHSPFDTAEVELIKRMTGKIREIKLQLPEAFSAKLGGKEVTLFTLKNKTGIVAQITNFGGRVVALWAPDRHSKFDDIVTGFKSLEEFRKTKEGYFGALIGRYANLNLTNHTFFNLHGFANGETKSINSHVLKMNASFYTPTDNALIPTGAIANVAGTPMDFRTPTAIGERLNVDFPDLINGKGYDHNWIIDKPANELWEVATVYEPSTGRQLNVYTTEPALQFYGGNFFDGTVRGKYGEFYAYRTSFALEAQHYPDSPNHANFPTTVLNPGETYRQITIYKFGVKY